MKFRKSFFGLIISALFVLFCAGCTQQPPASDTEGGTPLVVGYSAFNENFSPFYADNAPDMDVVSMTSVELLTTDRNGNIVYNGINGENIAYNGKEYTYTGIADLAISYDEIKNQTVYTWTIRDDIKFSDGQPLTADDIIFSYYVYSDPSYEGAYTLYTLPILGMQNYRTQTTDQIYQKYSQLFDNIFAAGRESTSTDQFTPEQQQTLWKLVDQEWINDLQSIVDYCMSGYLDYASDYTGYTADEIAANQKLQIMFAMVMWSFGEITEQGEFVGYFTGNSWDMINDFPTIEDFLTEAKAAYMDDPIAYSDTETIDGTTVYDQAKSNYISSQAKNDPELAGQSINSISGIKKISDTVVEITLAGYDATAIYSLDISVAPLHYYGDPAKYDYENSCFGFDFGDLSSIRAKTNTPFGAGPYIFNKYENGIVYFEANPYYYKGEPQIKYIQFKETPDEDKISGINTGTIDIADTSISSAAITEICSYNSNNELSGNKIETVTVEACGYGYAGINADTVNVGGEPNSAASINLRKGLATVLAAYRDISINSYYGDLGVIINYPITNTSWAAPAKTDDDYSVAFSKTIDGSEIYTSAMNDEQKQQAALAAAIDYFIAAGYTYDQTSGLFTAAPEGASLEYELIIPGEGNADHPAFMMGTMAAEALNSIGFNISIYDPVETSELWDIIEADSHQLWVSAWECAIDPDMYQIYHSDDNTGMNHFHIADAELDQLIMDARNSNDQAYRKTIYKACLDIILDWAVEVPIYQRLDSFVFSTERINTATITQDITTYWNWQKDIHMLEMN